MSNSPNLASSPLLKVTLPDVTFVASSALLASKNANSRSRVSCARSAARARSRSRSLALPSSNLRSADRRFWNLDAGDHPSPCCRTAPTDGVTASAGALVDATGNALMTPRARAAHERVAAVSRATTPGAERTNK
jgi:hypothetical protein